MNQLRHTAAVVLAAGAGTRFHGDSHKLLAKLNGRCVYRRALDQVIAANFTTIIVVTGAATLELPGGVIEAHNPNWSMGQSSSLLVGIDKAQGLGCTAIVVGLGDQPFLTAQSWRDVASNHSPIAVATYNGVRGHPVRLAQQVWELLGDEGDQGARSLMNRAPDLVVEVMCEGSPADIDTMEDLRQWNS